MANDETPLSYRILAALGGMRDAMAPEDVRAVQRFARSVGEAESAHPEVESACFPYGGPEPGQRNADDMGMPPR